MKKSVITAVAILIAFANVSMTSTQKALEKKQIEFSNISSSPLHDAVCKGDIENVKKSIEYGADVNRLVRNMSPLMLAARFNKVEIIKVLLANGAKTWVENTQGLTALDYAEYSKCVESIAILKNVK